MDPETYMLYIWLGVFIVSLIVEVATVSLVSIWFSVGALVALILSLIPGIPFWVEIIVFFVVSVILLASVRPLADRYLKRKLSKSNIDEIVGKKGVVIKDITEIKNGLVKIDDVTWTALNADESKTLHVQEIVEVVAVRGNKLIVRKAVSGEHKAS